MPAANSPTTQTSPREFVLTRVFDAPPSLVFKAWTDPSHMAKWWGPREYTNPVCELNVQPGGRWRIVMRGPDGIEHPCKGVYLEIVEPSRLVMTIDHSELPEQFHDQLNPNRDKSKGIPKLEAIMTVTFEPLGGKTRLTIRNVYESAAIRDSFLKHGMNEGWSQSLEKLASLVTK